ncbi:DUF6483 family protein [Paenibacillus cymbidii]|uniref:DUF6483 family protein n=1 Tax=Paenibacillus cymbidii TaxID=1639034 RepID=UPI00107FFBB4|nr:DUF6483 family protein [Paenibacillus cymbidii]
MFQRDYLLRMIQQMTEAIGAIAGLRKEMKKEQALQTLDETLSKFFRLNSKLLNSLSEKDLLAMMTTNELLSIEHATGVARLLKEEGDIFADGGDDEESYPRYVKALRLFLTVHEHEPDPGFLDLNGEIGGLLERLAPYELPVDVSARLVPYFEQTGQFAKAEDTLFDLPGAAGGSSGHEAWVEGGIAFYERLLLLDDDKLEAGNLPREEIEAALADMKAKQTAEA